MKYTVHKRTFEALKYPKGSPERIKLNEDNITSEYMTSYKFALKGPNLSTSFKTKHEAQALADKWNKKLNII